MNRLFLSVFILFSLSSFSQKCILPVSISWENPVDNYNSSSDNKVIYFSNAKYYDNNSLPFFENNIPLQSTEIINNANIEEPVFITPSEEELNILSTNKIIISNENILINTRYEIAAKKRSGILSFIPFRKNVTTGKIEKLKSADIIFEKTPVLNSTKQKHSYAENSLLSTGTWYKLKVKEEGVYKITYNDLIQQGIDVSSINPLNIRIFGNGGGMLTEANWESNFDDLIENAIYVEGESDGVFNANDYILFYGQAATKVNYDTLKNIFYHVNNIYSDYTYYFINFNSQPGKRIATQASETSTPNYIITKFNDFYYHEKDSINILKSGKEWYGEYFDGISEKNITFKIPNIDISTPAILKLNIAARNSNDTSIIEFSTDNKNKSFTIQPIPAGFTADYAIIGEDSLSFPPNDENINVNIKNTTAGAVAWLNFIEINAVRNLIFSSPQMLFRNTSCIGTGKITEFKLANVSPDIKIWDITDPFNISNQEFSINAATASFSLATDSLKQFIAFDYTNFYKSEFIGKVENQNIHGSTTPDMVIVTNPLFKTQAQRIANIHETLDNFNVAIYTPEEIYNEFSSGSPDITAIRNMMRMFYDRSDATNDYHKYLLLFGDASYDYKGILPGNTNFVPTYQSHSSLVLVTSYLTDDYYGVLDSTEGYYSNGSLDIGIGRFPVKTIEEAQGVVNKIEAYLSKNDTYTETNGCNTYTQENSGDWRNISCFIADDEDNDLHIDHAETIAKYVDTTYNNNNVYKIYLDAYKQFDNSYPDVNKAIDEQLQRGCLLLNYTGHGGETGLAGEGIVQISDILKWSNINNMPAFITASCEFSRFDDPSRTSAGELVLLNPHGGGIALFTTTRIAFAYSNLNFNKSFCKNVFLKDSINGYPRLGDILSKCKNENGCIINIRHIVLLGDPALRLSYPENTVVTTHINNHEIQTVPDTLIPLKQYTIKGIIQDAGGNKLSNFNGLIYPTVYDSKIWNTTLANDATSIPYLFNTQEKIIFKGKTSVINGDFEFSFVVPKDLNIDYGQARISYYAKNEYTDANGYYEGSDFMIGGIESTTTNDDKGPDIKLYINDTTFISGGTTDANPIFIAYLEDTTGIQCTGYELGHDMVATLDDSVKYILNDYYTPEMNTYKKGIINFPFTSLSEGIHTINLKAWDIANNSSSTTIPFIVTKPGNLSFKNLFNFPNPFNESTCFYFEHNQPCCDIDVEIEIFNITGLLVKEIKQTILTSGNNFNTLCWDGCDNAGNRLNSGVYLYRIKVISGNDSWLESTNRLIILR
ncbi:MAG TPA: type IX secretion system sortase PorU [Bacteroidales bacterium]|nr:type IX secretion system sortase PorU [Bacteroidales bacterium]HPS16965.1 type IX secretion system sortase PorU [Bacteroidales bacterium]